ncbi:MAG: Eco57I restriction-modification methylase domain-containing protein, partial [Anaerolineae bacterium]|nr:Eco57I restriction-modification methylase domain-containing protein [Anaerolineae bacterium]
RYFGLELTSEQWQAVRKLTTTDMTPPALQSLVNEAERLAGEQHFFHWELAFPEIFFDADGQPKQTPGFDAVVGNPPYVRQERIQPIKPFLQQYYEIYSGTADLFLYFYELGLQFVKEAHRLGYITSGTYMNSNSAKPFRQYIHDNAGMEWVANFGENQPFRGAEMVYPTIAVMRSHTANNTFNNLFMEGNVPFSDLQSTLEKGDWVDSLSEATGFDEWRFQPAELTFLFSKIIHDRTSLDAYLAGRMYSGIKTGLNEAFVVDTATFKELVTKHSSSSEILQPILRGQDLRPWHYQESGSYLILAKQGLDIESYPAIKEHLEKYRNRLERRTDTFDEWYELRPCDYYDAFEGQKIIWPDISKLPRFSWNEGAYLNNTGFFISGVNFAFLALLQSRVLWFAMSQLAQPLRLRAGLWQFRVIPQFVERLPIPDLMPQQESDLAAIAEEITGLARSRYQLHENFRQTLRNEFNGDEISTRVALYRWWELSDEKALSDEVSRRFGVEIPLGKRSDWRGYLAEETGKHQQLTQQIITLETRMNEIVYDAFDLTPEERQLIEETTKYPYGEV